MNQRPFEYCFLCDEPTGRAGRGDDSLYCDECDTGPYCSSCFDEHHRGNELAKENKRLLKILQGEAEYDLTGRPTNWVAQVLIGEYDE